MSNYWTRMEVSISNRYKSNNRNYCDSNLRVILFSHFYCKKKSLSYQPLCGHFVFHICNLYRVLLESWYHVFLPHVYIYSPSLAASDPSYFWFILLLFSFTSSRSSYIALLFNTSLVYYTPTLYPLYFFCFRIC